MSYTRTNVTVRMIRASEDAFVLKPFEAHSLTVDSCNPSSRRFTLQARPDGPITEYAWYEVITDEDNARTRTAKLRHARAVGAAYVELAAAQKRYRALTT